MKKVVSVLVAIIMVLICVSSCADSIPAKADYTIPNDVKATAEDQFYGIWAAQYIGFFGIPYRLEDLDASMTFSFEIYKDHAMLIASNTSYYCIGRQFKDGKLSFTDESGTITLTLHDDGSISFLSDGYPVYCIKQDIQYGDLNYKALARTPENYIGQYVTVTGTVLQTIGSRRGDYYQIRLAVDGDYSKELFIEFVNIPEYNLLENDSVTVNIRLAGEYSYTTVLGAVVTVPLAFAQGVVLNE